MIWLGTGYHLVITRSDCVGKFKYRAAPFNPTIAFLEQWHLLPVAVSSFAQLNGTIEVMWGTDRQGTIIAMDSTPVCWLSA